LLDLGRLFERGAVILLGRPVFFAYFTVLKFAGRKMAVSILPVQNHLILPAQ